MAEAYRVAAMNGLKPFCFDWTVSAEQKRRLLPAFFFYAMLKRLQRRIVGVTDRAFTVKQFLYVVDSLTHL